MDTNLPTANPPPPTHTHLLPALSKAFVDDKLSVSQTLKLSFKGLKKLWEKKRKCCLSVFSLFLAMFSKGDFSPGEPQSLLYGRGVKRKGTSKCNAM